MSLLYQIDFAINDWIAAHFRCSFLDSFLKVVSFLSDGGWFWILLALIFLFFRPTRRYGLAMAISLLLSTFFTNLLLKPIVARPRPYELRDLVITLPLPGDASFPSGHTTVAFSGAFSLFWQNKKAGAPALVLALLTAFSRLYFYLHFPTDILGGFVVGLLSSLLSTRILPHAERGLCFLGEEIRSHRKEKKDR